MTVRALQHRIAVDVDRRCDSDQQTAAARAKLENGPAALISMSCHGRARRSLIVTPPIPPRTTWLEPKPNMAIIAACASS